MGVVGDVLDRFKEFPTPVKVLTVGGIAVAGYLGYRAYQNGGLGSGGGSGATGGGSIPIDLAPQGTTDNLTTNGGSGSSGTTGGSSSTGGSTGGSSSGTGTTGSSGSSGSSGTGTTKPKTGGGSKATGGTKKPKTGGGGGGGHTTSAHSATVAHLKTTAAVKKHPNLGYGTHHGGPNTSQGLR